MLDITEIYCLLGWANIAIATLGCFCVAKGWGRILLPLATLTWTAQLLAHFDMASFYSLSGVAPTTCIGAVLLCLWQLLFFKGDLADKSIRPQVNMFFLLLLGLSSLVVEEVRHNSFMMTYIYAVLFFLSRPLSLGFALFALAGMADDLYQGHGRNKRILASAKDAAFFASILFLGGEIVGCYWGFVGWGTTWRWSGNFFFSAMLFVLLMIPLHVPRKVFSSAKAYNLAFSAPLIVVVLCIVLSKVVNV